MRAEQQVRRESAFLGGRFGLAFLATFTGAVPVALALLTRTYLLFLAAPAAALAVLLAASLASTRRLAMQNRMKDDFVAMVAHELRTPLTSIQGSVKTLLRLHDLDEMERRQFLEAVDRQSDRLCRLTDRLLLLQQLDAGVEPVSMTRVPLRTLTEYVLFELRGRTGRHEFRVDFEPELIEIGSTPASSCWSRSRRSVSRHNRSL